MLNWIDVPHVHHTSFNSRLGFFGFSVLIYNTRVHTSNYASNHPGCIMKGWHITPGVRKSHRPVIRLVFFHLLSFRKRLEVRGFLRLLCNPKKVRILHLLRKRRIGFFSVIKMPEKKRPEWELNPRLHGDSLYLKKKYNTGIYDLPRWLRRKAQPSHIITAVCSNQLSYPVIALTHLNRNLTGFQGHRRGSRVPSYP